MPFTCSICEEESTQICARCTKDACDNHICEKCLRCSDCCECEMRMAEPLRMMVHPPQRAMTPGDPDPEPEPHAPIPGPDPDPAPDSNNETASAAGGTVIPGPDSEPDPELPEPDSDPVLPPVEPGPDPEPNRAPDVLPGGGLEPLPA